MTMSETKFYVINKTFILGKRNGKQKNSTPQKRCTALLILSNLIQKLVSFIHSLHLQKLCSELLVHQLDREHL
ncbi:hypothetical protein SAMN04488137_3992 [Fictibacillus solisalsi]|uniref:Uncharacterized protein n=1 Tax=Fictibacillus solisalsi TaxID=459525 RepID=A0A1H0A8F1_9BACL|nr:hypothetical protein SAMN04488137_3992 [Fictibacillus solisalsi]